MYGMLMSLRNWAYDSGAIKVEKASVPVISVGNLTVGGTGKSPLIMKLVDWFRSQDLSVGVVSRGYKAAYQGSEEVELNRPDAAHFFGDEPVMIKSRFPGVPVVVGRKRVEACQKLLENHKVNFILADDAFQHRKLHRDFDIVVVDAYDDPDRFHVLPFGRGREPLSQIERADIAVLNRANVAPKTNVAKWEDVFHRYNVQYISSNTVLRYPENIKKVLLVSAIGRPQSFESLVKVQGIEVAEHLIFRDHYSYQASDVAQMLLLMKKHNVQIILTTEKDDVKLNKFNNLAPFLQVARLQLDFAGADGKFYEKLKSAIHI